MAWLDGWKYRVPVAVNNSVPAATVDVSIPIPGDWDLFWDTIDASGVEIRVTYADGITAATYQLGASPAFNRTNKTGVIELDGLTADNATASVVLCWLYFGQTGASTGAGSFVAASAVAGYIQRTRPSGFVVPARPVEPGTTRPMARVQKTVGEQFLVWFEMRGMLEHRTDDSGDSRVWEEVFQVVSVVSAAGTPDATLTTVSRTRFAEVLEGGRPAFYVGIFVKAGTTATNYTIEPVIDTVAPEITYDAGALALGEYRILEPRAMLSVKDITEV